MDADIIFSDGLKFLDKNNVNTELIVVGMFLVCILTGHLALGVFFPWRLCSTISH